MTRLHRAQEKAFFLEWAPRDPKLFSFFGGVTVWLSLNQSRRMSKWVVLTQEPQEEKEKLDVTEDGLCNVLCDALLPVPFTPLLPFSPFTPHSLLPSPRPFSSLPSSVLLPSLSLLPSRLSFPPLSFSLLSFTQFSLSSAAQHQPHTRVGALVVHHPGYVTTPVGLDRTPTVHWGRYDGRPWVARTTQYAIAGDVFCFSFACDVFFLFFCRRFSFVRVFSSAGVFFVLWWCRCHVPGMLLTLPLCFSSLPVCVCVRVCFFHARECFFPWPVCVFFLCRCVYVCVCFSCFFCRCFFLTLVFVFFYFLPVFCFSTASDFSCSLLRPEILSFSSASVSLSSSSSASDFFFPFLLLVMVFFFLPSSAVVFFLFFICFWWVCLLLPVMFWWFFLPLMLSQRVAS